MCPLLLCPFPLYLELRGDIFTQVQGPAVSENGSKVPYGLSELVPQGPISPQNIALHGGLVCSWEECVCVCVSVCVCVCERERERERGSQ